MLGFGFRFVFFFCLAGGGGLRVKGLRKQSWDSPEANHLWMGLKV